ncbi:hypothetical protein DVH07_18620 [Hafnia paralvei]|uniref:hypothetical protein n=1 Tax=Hafnia paralvei TaxID=546367 RepID=UPI000DF4BC34|nr:hypothetical protein [Hafnia paralvei]ECZ3990887.1 hypothetical protein [Salmonella enterica]ELX3202684.1 hypothetical protein [Salmonella enterica]RDA61943.1 hypothetical protein DU449_18180 [Hafnia paralvei]RDA63003.1 hypothetical protein DVH08_20390 [Hafnia paralvei]RDA63843.1 hypothetical protein DVH09_18750 [Hafnia paralvei]
MKNQYMLPGFIWLPERGAGRKAYLLKLDKEIKNRFSYVENKQNKQRGFYQGEFNAGTALALYISKYLGDGIYSSNDPELIDTLVGTSEVLPISSDAVYFLIIADGKVMEGTDVVIKRDLYDFIINQIADTEFSNLNSRTFTTEELFELNRKYISDMVSEDKNPNYTLGLVIIIFLILCGGGIAWLILMT